MKTIKLLLIISQLAVCVQFINAQAMMPNVSYMYMIKGTKNERQFLIRDTYDLSNLKDTNFQYVVITQETMLVHGNKVYYKNKFFPNNGDSILYFDFDLKVNDKINIGYLNYLYVVDSIKSIQLLDSNFYLHWFLSSKQSSINLIWIKGLGDSRTGWISDGASFTPESSPSLQAICRDNKLVYWDHSFNYFYPDTVQPTCDFDGLRKKYTSIAPINVNLVTVFPNPANNKITIEIPNQNLKNYQANIYDYKGSLVQNVTIINSEIDITELSQGLYLLEVMNVGENNNIGQQRFTGKFVKE